MPVQGPVQHHVAVVAGQRSIHFYRFALAALEQSPHAVRIIVLPVQDAAMLRQVMRRARLAKFFQVGWRCAQQTPVRHDLAR